MIGFERRSEGFSFLWLVLRFADEMPSNRTLEAEVLYSIGVLF